MEKRTTNEEETGAGLRIEGLSFRYATGGFTLSIPELRVPPGGRAAVVGPSGSGKTTLLHLVAGIERPEAGSILVGETEVTALGEAARRTFRIRRMGLVFQEFELLDYLDVLQNVLLPYRVSTTLRLTAGDRARAEDLAARIGLADKLRRPVRRLSQGERQRVAVCRALVTAPDLLLADEPTGNLDPANKDRVLEEMFEAAAGCGATVLAVTHDHGVLDRFDQVVDAGDWGRA